MTEGSSGGAGVLYEDARCRVLAEHEVLRVVIAQLRQAAVLVVQGGGCAQELHDTGRTLCFVLEAHALREDGLLHPAFVPDEGRRRLQNLRDRQRQVLAELRTAHGCGPLRYAATAARLTSSLLALLELEEDELFGREYEVPGGVPWHGS